MAKGDVAPALARPLSHWALLAGLVVMWGSSPALNKLAVASLPPIVVVAARLSIASLLLLALAAARGEHVPRSPRHLAFFAASGAFGAALPFFLITWGQQALPSGLVAVFFAIMPLTTLLLAHFFVSGERLAARRLAGFVVGFLGILALVGNDVLAELAGTSGVLIFELAIMAGAMCYAVNTIVARLRPEGDVIAMAAGALAASSLMTLPPALVLTSTATLDPTITGLAAVLALAIVGTAAPTVVFFNLVSLAGASFASMINYLIPVWGLMVGITLMGEALQARAVLALLLILAGIMLAERRSAPSAE